jgi:hypothetical protein
MEYIKVSHLIFVGTLLLFVGCEWFDQMNYSSGGLAVYTIKMAVTKCTMPFGNMMVMGVSVIFYSSKAVS